MSVRTVKVSNVSLRARDEDLKEFFSFSGEIQFIELHPEDEKSQTVYVTFRDPQGANTAALFSGATIVDQSVVIALTPYYELPGVASAASSNASGNKNTEAVVSAVRKAEDVVSSMLAKGFTLSKDALNKAKAFDNQYNLTSTASAKVASIDQKVGLSEKISAGTTIVNDKVKEMDQKFQVSEKTKSAIASAEQSVSSARSVIMNNRYVLTGATWVTGAFNRVVARSPDVLAKNIAKENVSEVEQDDNHGIKDQVETDLVHEPVPATNAAAVIKPANPSV